MRRALLFSCSVLALACDDDTAAPDGSVVGGDARADADKIDLDLTDASDRDGGSDAAAGDAGDARIPPDIGRPPDAATREGLAPIGRVDSDRFVTSPACSECHTNTDQSQAMRDGQGRPISQFDLWRSSMMANASRDPFWRAVVAAEVASHPDAAAAIELKCMRCHAPMAVYDEPQRIALLDGDSPESLLGLDGVSCTACHQIQEAGLGTPESWTGGFIIGDDREVNALHENIQAGPMEIWTGFRPVRGLHQRQPELCATCHTLISGNGFAEQTPYLEWRHARVAQTCQGCHVPQTDADGEPVATQVANTRGGTDDPQLEVRTPFGRHLFVGGNTIMLSILRDQADWLRPNAPPEAFDATIEATRQQLTERAATFAVAARRDQEALEVTVSLRNLAGHKLPTAYPSRRVWIRLEVRDREGQVRFLSGDYDVAGRLLGADGLPLPSEFPGGPIEPHRDRVAHGEVQVYEAVMTAGGDGPTFSVVDATANLKDNRIPPIGWRANPPPEIAPVGVEGDPDFGPTDAVHFRVDDVLGVGLEVNAQLLYQSISARFVAELAQADAPEVRRFLDFYEQADRRPVVMRTAEARVE